VQPFITHYWSHGILIPHSSTPTPPPRTKNNYFDSENYTHEAVYLSNSFAKKEKNYTQNTYFSLLTKSGDSVKNEEALQSRGGNKHPTHIQ